MILNVTPGLPPQKVAFFLFSIFFIVVMLIIAIAIPFPTESQWRVFNWVLSLVAAAMAAVLPGVFELKFTPWLRASGSLAVFAFVFLIQPAGLVSYNPSKPLGPPPPIENAMPVVDQWLSINDSKDHKAAYAQMSERFRSQYRFDDFSRLAREGRDVFGKVVERRSVGQNSSEASAGERGYVRIYSFLTRFEFVSEPIEEAVSVFGKESTDVWVPAGYNLNIQRGSAALIRDVTNNKITR